MPIAHHSHSTTSRVNTCQPHTRSAFDRNFTAAASSRNPIVVLSDTIHAPPFGNRASHPGTSASTTKGKAKVVEKIASPSAGQRQLPCDAVTRSVPTNGAVQVNDVSAKVSPMSSVDTL